MILNIESRSKIQKRINSTINEYGISELYSFITNRLSTQTIQNLKHRLSPLIGIQLPILNIPKSMLIEFEPSQIGTIVGTLMDASIPQLDSVIKNSNIINEIGLLKHEGIQGEREGYPDYKTNDGYRMELKLLYVDPINVAMKKPPTPREASARLTQKVTYKNVDTSKDLLLIIAYQFQETNHESYSPTIIDIGLFPVIDCILARDIRLSQSGGRWFGDFETPAILSRQGKAKTNTHLNISNYGRKESEGYDFNEDTNFGKLARIPYKELQEFLKKHNSKYTSKGVYPNKWVI